MDPNSTFTLKIRLFGNRKKMREGYTYGYFELVIDSDLSNYKDLVGEIVEKRPPGYLEVAHCQFYDDALKNFPKIKSDQDLMLCDPSEPFEPIHEWPSCVPSCVSRDNGETEDSYLCNPLPENEHVGVDEEVLYLEKAPVEVVAEDNDKECFGHGDGEGDGEGGDHGEGGDDGEDDGEGGDDGDSELEIEAGSELESDPELVEQMENLEYDKDDPPMTVGSTYPSMAEFMAEFKIALQTYAIKHEFEYNIAKSAPYRFTAYCSRKVEDNCRWRLHASVKDDLCTVMVICNLAYFFIFCFAIFILFLLLIHVHLL
ncbi:hypothetical protein HU200_000716 [Digitaria exilis]|uniref:Transposase MuDR plant domain-containing protein n=1 Tax=Digitaria exilis TaxID=1010633 RepID=A0A835KXU7_9POAL|nr:hypothetical protein HU200_000716 [Digitaria exilis]